MLWLRSILNFKNQNENDLDPLYLSFLIDFFYEENTNKSLDNQSHKIETILLLLFQGPC